MNPREFHKLATELVRGSRPVDYRTAISRAYYAVYNVCGDVLESMGFRVSKGPAGHGEVQVKFHNCGVPEVIRVASQLSDLQGQRIKADYRMNERIVESEATAKTLVEQAGRMLNILQQCLCEPKRSEIKKAIQQYEQKIKEAGR